MAPLVPIYTHSRGGEKLIIYMLLARDITHQREKVSLFRYRRSTLGPLLIEVGANEK